MAPFVRFPRRRARGTRDKHGTRLITPGAGRTLGSRSGSRSCALSLSLFLPLVALLATPLARASGIPALRALPAVPGAAVAYAAGPAQQAGTDSSPDGLLDLPAALEMPDSASPAPPTSRLVRLDVLRREPFAGGQPFGDVGPYQKLAGVAHFKADPAADAQVTDLALAPRDDAGLVDYETDFLLLMPADPARGNGLLFYSAVNRGNLGGLNALDDGVAGDNDPTADLDGFALRRGYTFLWSGWQPDVAPGAGRLVLRAPVAREPDGSPITGLVRGDYVVSAPAPTVSLGGGWYTGRTTPSYPAAALDDPADTLTVRRHEQDSPVPVPRDQWAFADCSTTPFPGIARPDFLCVRGGLSPDAIYELLYTARDPYVGGLGFTATRDLVSFLRYAPEVSSAGTGDPTGTGLANPLAGAIRAAVMEGTSQSGRYVRSFLDLGFNQDPQGRIVFDGMNPHLAAGRVPLNVRFGQPGRAYGQHEDHLYPASEFPQSWETSEDPLTGRAAGLLDRCRATDTCPKIMQTVTSTEYWQARMSLNTTDPLGQSDLPMPDNVRIYLFAGTQHGAAPWPPSPGICQVPANPNPIFEERRALLVALEQWVLDGVEPPPSAYPTLATGTLVSPDPAAVHWPAIPGLPYTGRVDTLPLVDFGAAFDARTMSGIIAEPLQVASGEYAVLVPAVDPDGNEVAGIRTPSVAVPLGTYTGWNLRRAGYAEGDLCHLQGAFVPFAATRAERLASGDPRPSLEERYGTRAAYTAMVHFSTASLVAQRFLLPEDAARVIQQTLSRAPAALY